MNLRALSYQGVLVVMLRWVMAVSMAMSKLAPPSLFVTETLPRTVRTTAPEGRLRVADDATPNTAPPAASAPPAKTVLRCKGIMSSLG